MDSPVAGMLIKDSPCLQLPIAAVADVSLGKLMFAKFGHGAAAAAAKKQPTTLHGRAQVQLLKPQAL